MVDMILQNKGLDIQIKDRRGVNAFWIATILGHGEVMKSLAEAGIDVLNTDSQG